MFFLFLLKISDDTTSTREMIRLGQRISNHVTATAMHYPAS
jgi:hypothetical protein